MKDTSYGRPETIFRLPFITPRLKITGTLSAEVVGGYKYAYINNKGQYRVSLRLALDKWSPGGDSRPEDFTYYLTRMEA